MLKGTADIPRLTVHRGSEYIISRATFPCYFIKEQSVINHCYTEIDLKIFRQYLAPAQGVTHRFVGTEPFCRVTAQYNQDMRYWLETPTISAPPIELVEIERLRYQEDADIRFPGTSTAGEKRSHGYRAAGPCSHAALFAEPA